VGRTEAGKMTTRLMVFVCGTYSDLSEERGAVLDAILRLQLQHDSMEFFGARPERPIETCLQEVRNSDILVVIVGRKYGSIVPGWGISYSEAEYREAQRLNIPCLVYFLDQGKSITSEQSQHDPDSLKKLETWKADLKQKHTPYHFKDSTDLALQAVADLGREIRKLEKTASAVRPGAPAAAATRAGWVREAKPRLRLRFCQRFGDEERQLLYGLAVDRQGNVIIAGSFWGEVNFGGAPLRSAGDRNIFVGKFDRNGRHLWSNRFGDSAEKVAVGVEVDASGAIFIVSAFTGTLDFGGPALASKGRYSVGLAKLDPNGHHLWSRSFGEGYCVPECFAVTSDGGVVVAGRFTDSIDFGGEKIRCESSQTDIFLASLSSEGQHRWVRRFGGPYEQQTRSIATGGDGCIALAGVFKGSIGFDGQQLMEDQPGDYCGFLAKLGEDGYTHWCKRFGEPSAEQGSAVAFDRNNGDIIASGFIRNKLPVEASKKLQSLCLLARYDPSGILEWSKTFGARAFPDTLSVVPGGDILLTGHFELSVDFGSGPLVSAGGNDIFAAIFSPDGDPLLSERFGDARQQFLVRGVHDARGLVVLAGSFHGTIDLGKGPMTASGYDGTSEGKEDVFLAVLETQSPDVESVDHL
jgi:hypothetical protein